jgi:hypothetical protein
LARALKAVEVVDVDYRLACNAGLLLAAASPQARRLLAVDALVVACAAIDGDLVLTTDPGDLGPLVAAAQLKLETP